jgi:hypothetical protein
MLIFRKTQGKCTGNTKIYAKPPSLGSLKLIGGPLGNAWRVIRDPLGTFLSMSTDV